MMQRRDFLGMAIQGTAMLGLPLLNSRAIAAAESGISAKHVTFASSLAVTGILAGTTAEVVAGIQAAFRAVNRTGGVHGRELKSLVMDDGYVVKRTVDNHKDVIANNTAIAFLSGQGTPTNAAVLPLTEQAGVPVIAPITGGDSLRQDKYRYTFFVRASYRDETRRLMTMMAEMGMKDIALIYLDNPYGKEVLGFTTEAMKASNLSTIGNFALAVNGSNGAELARQVAAANPGAVYLITTGSANTAFLAPFREARPTVPAAGLSVSVLGAEMTKLGDRLHGYAQTEVIPNAKKESLAIVRTFHADMLAIDQGARISAASLEGWINAQVAIEGLRRAGRDLTRESLRQGIAGIQHYDLGGFMINYSGSTPYVGSRFVEMAIYGPGGRRL